MENKNNNKNIKFKKKSLTQNRTYDSIEDTINAIIKKVKIGIALIQAEYKDKLITDFSCIKINDTIKKITGSNNDNIIKKKFFNFFPESKKKFLNVLINVIKNYTII